MMKPLIMTSLPVPTRERTEIFNGCEAMALTLKTWPLFPRVR